MHNLGHTRSANRRDHLLLTPDTFVRTPMPGMQNGMAIVHVSPAVGAAFTQYTAELDPGGALGPTTTQRFVYVLSGGGVDLSTDTSFHALSPYDYAYIPAGLAHTVTAQSATRLAVIEKIYQPLAEIAVPALLVGSEAKVTSTALMGDIGLQVRSLLPDQPGFDFA
ncbi:MAG TPA: cupin domain-containing protein, partial [Acidobacteriaceae bacterium]